MQFLLLGDGSSTKWLWQKSLVSVLGLSKVPISLSVLVKQRLSPEAVRLCWFWRICRELFPTPAPGRFSTGIRSREKSTGFVAPEDGSHKSQLLQAQESNKLSRLRNKLTRQNLRKKTFFNNESNDQCLVEG